LALVDSLQSLPKKPGVKVVQLLGGVGNPAVEAHATRLTSRMAQMVNGDAVYLPVAGILATEAVCNVLMADEVTQQATRLFGQVTTALVGKGALDPSPLLAQSGNIFPPQELNLLRQKKTVGDNLLSFLIHIQFMRDLPDGYKNKLAGSSASSKFVGGGLVE
jgi:DNA-binding transcriptional regulator LsrR (DeoR family)